MKQNIDRRLGALSQDRTMSLLKGVRKVKSSSGFAWAGIGFEFVGIFLACTAFGWWLDGLLWPSKNWLLLAGVFLGFFAALLHILIRSKEMEASESRKKVANKESNQSKSIQEIKNEIDDVEKKYKEFFSKRDSGDK